MIGNSAVRLSPRPEYTASSRSCDPCAPAQLRHSRSERVTADSLVLLFGASLLLWPSPLAREKTLPACIARVRASNVCMQKHLDLCRCACHVRYSTRIDAGARARRCTCAQGLCVNAVWGAYDVRCEARDPQHRSAHQELAWVCGFWTTVSEAFSTSGGTGGKLSLDPLRRLPRYRSACFKLPVAVGSQNPVYNSPFA